MSSLSTFIDEVIALLKTVSGLGQVGRTPNDLAKWPAVPVYSASGRLSAEFGQVAHWAHDVRVGLLGPYDGDTAKVQTALAPILEPLVEALIKRMLAKQFTSIDNFVSIDYVFGPLEWSGQLYFGFLLTIRGVKIRRVMT